MTGLLLFRTRAAWRRKWPSLLAIALLVAIAFAVTATAVAGARRRAAHPGDSLRKTARPTSRCRSPGSIRCVASRRSPRCPRCVTSVCSRAWPRFILRDRRVHAGVRARPGHRRYRAAPGRGHRGTTPGPACIRRDHALGGARPNPACPRRRPRPLGRVRRAAGQAVPLRRRRAARLRQALSHASALGARRGDRPYRRRCQQPRHRHLRLAARRPVLRALPLLDRVDSGPRGSAPPGRDTRVVRRRGSPRWAGRSQRGARSSERQRDLRRGRRPDDGPVALRAGRRPGRRVRGGPGGRAPGASRRRRARRALGAGRIPPGAGGGRPRAGSPRHGGRSLRRGARGVRRVGIDADRFRGACRSRPWTRTRLVGRGRRRRDRLPRRRGARRWARCDRRGDGSSTGGHRAGLVALLGRNATSPAAAVGFRHAFSPGAAAGRYRSVPHSSVSRPRRRASSACSDSAPGSPIWSTLRACTAGPSTSWVWIPRTSRRWSRTPRSARSPTSGPRSRFGSAVVPRLVRSSPRSSATSVRRSSRAGARGARRDRVGRRHPPRGARAHRRHGHRVGPSRAARDASRR